MLTVVEAHGRGAHTVRALLVRPTDQVDLADFPKLEALTLAGFAALPSWSPPRTLRELSLTSWDAGLDAGALCRWIRSLNELQRLTLFMVPIKKAPALASLQPLTELVLDEAGLTSLPSELYRVATCLRVRQNKIKEVPVPPVDGRVVELDLSHNKIERLEPELFRHTVLRRLHLAANKLKLLPSVPNGALELLDIDGNAISELPSALAGWSALTELGLARLPLQAFPAVVLEISRLGALRLGRVRELPAALGDLRGLERLSIVAGASQRGAGLASLPKRFTELAALRTLTIGGFMLEVLPEDLGRLSALEELHLLNVKLTALPASIGELARLRELRCDTHQIRRSADASSFPPLCVPDSLFSCEALEALQLHSGQIERLPAGIGRLRRLRVLGLAHNQLSELPRELEELTELTHLDVSNNRLMDLEPLDFSRLPRLVSMDVSCNQLRRLAPSLERCSPSQFAAFSFHTNPIEGVPAWLSRQERLRSLDVRQTAIKEPPRGLRPDVVVYI